MKEKTFAERIGQRTLSIEERFLRFHDANPQVYQALAEKARELKKRGIHRWSIANLFEMLRHQHAVLTGSPLKIDNSYRSRYARLLMQHEPDLQGFFRVRHLREANGQG